MKKQQFTKDELGDMIDKLEDIKGCLIHYSSDWKMSECELDVSDILEKLYREWRIMPYE